MVETPVLQCCISGQKCYFQLGGLEQRANLGQGKQNWEIPSHMISGSADRPKYKSWIFPYCLLRVILLSFCIINSLLSIRE